MKPSTITQLLVTVICKAVTTARNETVTFLSQHAESFVGQHAESFVSTRAPASSFRLRLTWKNGYMWQESRSERWWCMRCKSSSCAKGSGIEIDKCSRNDSRQQFYFDNNRIRSKKSGRCLERRGRSIKLDTCDSSRNQRWDGLSISQPFQLREAGSNVKCASQHHEPKKGEVIYMTSCKKSRASKTDLWVSACFRSHILMQYIPFSLSS